MWAIAILFTAHRHSTGLQREIQTNNHEHTEDAARPRCSDAFMFVQIKHSFSSQLICLGDKSYTPDLRPVYRNTTYKTLRNGKIASHSPARLPKTIVFSTLYTIFKRGSDLLATLTDTKLGNAVDLTEELQPLTSDCRSPTNPILVQDDQSVKCAAGYGTKSDESD
jgi:hypothetical protein